MVNNNNDILEANKFADNLGLIECSPSAAKKVARLCFECGSGHVPVYMAEAGIGKSQLARQLAQEMDARALFFFLAHKEREDIGGIPFPNTEGTSYQFLCEQSILDVINSGEPTLIVLDEWNRGEKQVMNAAFTMMEDRRFGSHKLPDNVYIMACMNPSEGNYLVNETEKDPAFRRRLCFIAIRPDVVSWLDYATGSGKFHPLVTGFIQASPSSLMDVEAREAGKVYANPASWEKVSQTLYTMERLGMDILRDKLTLRLKLAGHINAGMAENFVTWVANSTILVNPEDILSDYKKVGAKIRKLVKNGRTDLIGDACKGVSLHLMTATPKPSLIVDNIGAFARDLSAEFKESLFTFFAQHANELDRRDYFMRLSVALSKCETYLDAVTSIHTANTLVEDEANKGKDEG